MKKSKTMKRKQRGGENMPVETPAVRVMAGGKKHGKKTRKASKWALAVKKVYQEMKSKDKSTTFMAALKRASTMKKKGELKL